MNGAAHDVPTDLGPLPIWALEAAGRAWAHPTTCHLKINVQLALVFASILAKQGRG
jgi:hypothetical protein